MIHGLIVVQTLLLEPILVGLERICSRCQNRIAKKMVHFWRADRAKRMDIHAYGDITRTQPL